MKQKVFISRKLPEDLLKHFQIDYDVEMWQEADIPVPNDILDQKVKEADALFCTISENLDANFFKKHSHLKVVSNMAVGFDNIDVNAAKKAGVIVTNTPDVLTESTADLTFGLLMITARKMIEANQVIHEDKWKEWAPFFLTGSDIHHKTIGIVGMGRIGEAVARRALGFSMHVIYHNRTRKYSTEKNLNVRYSSFADLIKVSDFVISLVPATPETENMFNDAVFKQMKQSAIFVNASRGQVVDEKALVNALKHKEITACGLDVFKNEPINSAHPLAQLSNAILLPHIGSATYQTRVAMIQLCLENIDRVLKNQPPKTPVN